MSSEYMPPNLNYLSQMIKSILLAIKIEITQNSFVGKSTYNQ
jgi:hypothetical protein